MALDRDSRGFREEMGRQLKSSRIQPSQRMATNSSATMKRMGRGQMRERNSASPYVTWLETMMAPPSSGMRSWWMMRER